MNSLRFPNENSAVPTIEDVNKHGFAILPDILDRAEIVELIRTIGQLESKDGVRTRGGVYAVRNLLQVCPEILELATSAKLLTIVREHIGIEAFAVRGMLFDKTGDANWLVPWHQDLTICVAARLPAPCYGPWTVKAGVCHVQPPASILEGMLSIRIHLDDCGENNGPLRVLPGTHRLGRLTADRISELQHDVREQLCLVKQGGALLMRPLLLHASSAATTPEHRRVVHIDYSSSQLDYGLRWLPSSHHLPVQAP